MSHVLKTDQLDRIEGVHDSAVDARFPLELVRHLVDAATASTLGLAREGLSPAGACPFVPFPRLYLSSVRVSVDGSSTLLPRLPPTLDQGQFPKDAFAVPLPESYKCRLLVSQLPAGTSEASLRGLFSASGVDLSTVKMRDLKSKAVGGVLSTVMNFPSPALATAAFAALPCVSLERDSDGLYKKMVSFGGRSIQVKSYTEVAPAAARPATTPQVASAAVVSAHG